MNELMTWTVYDHPIDFPDFFVARQFKNLRPTKNIIMSKSLTNLQRVLIHKGFGKISRSGEDDPVIVEVWL